MHCDEIERQLSAFLAEEKQILIDAPDQDLITSGLLDSLTLVDLIVFCEESFEVSFSLDDIDFAHFGSLRSIAALIAARRGARAPDQRAP